MSIPDIQRDINKLYTQVAVASDQANRALRGLDDIDCKLDEKLELMDRRIEGKLDNVGDHIHQIKNTLVRLETEGKSNNKWIGWVFAAVVTIINIAFNFLSLR